MVDQHNKASIDCKLEHIYDQLSALWTDNDIVCHERMLADLPKGEVDEAQDMVFQALELIKKAQRKVGYDA